MRGGSTLYFEQNKAIVKRRFNIEAQLSDKSQVKLIETKSKDIALTGVFEDQTFNIHSRFGPKKEAERWKNNLIGAPGTTYIIYGFGLGYHIEMLLQSCKEDDTVVVIEPSKDIFCFSLRHRDYKFLFEDSRLVLYLEPSEDELDLIFSNHISFIDLDVIKFQHLTPYDHMFLDNYKLTLDKFQRKLSEKKVDLNTVFHFAEKWQKNFVMNLRSIVDSAPFSKVVDQFKNKPVVIVSAGPSLDKNVHMLREIRDSALIICAGSAIRSLNKHNIKPHIVVTIDGGDINAQHFESLMISDYHLFFTASCHPNIPKKHKGAKWYFQHWGQHLDNWLKSEILECDPGNVKSGPSVANFCFDMAMQFSGDPICFIGQDLAYTDNRTHASGSLFEEKRVYDEQVHEKRLSIPGYEGKDVFTDVTLYSMLKYFENYIYSMMRQGKKEQLVINATEGGAKIKGTEQMPFRQFISKFCSDKFYPEHILEECYKNNKFDVSIKQKMLDELEKHISEVKKIEEIASRGRKFADKLVDYYRIQKTTNVKKMVSKLDHVDSEIKQLQSRHLFLSIMMQVGVFKVLKGFKAKSDENEREKGIRISEQSLVFYKSIEYTAKEMIPVIEEVISDLKGSETGYESINESLSKL
jgi:hypothetical protein